MVKENNHHKRIFYGWHILGLLKYKIIYKISTNDSYLAVNFFILKGVGRGRGGGGGGGWMSHLICMVKSCTGVFKIIIPQNEKLRTRTFSLAVPVVRCINTGLLTSDCAVVCWSVLSLSFGLDWCLADACTTTGLSLENSPSGSSGRCDSALPMCCPFNFQHTEPKRKKKIGEKNNRCAMRSTYFRGRNLWFSPDTCSESMACWLGLGFFSRKADSSLFAHSNRPLSVINLFYLAIEAYASYAWSILWWVFLLLQSGNARPGLAVII